MSGHLCPMCEMPVQFAGLCDACEKDDRAAADAVRDHRRALYEASRSTKGGSMLAHAEREANERARDVAHENSDEVRLRAARREV